MLCLANLKYQLLALTEHPDWLPTLVEQQWLVWGYDAPNYLAEFYRQSLSNAMPKVWIFVDTSQFTPILIGGVALSLDEMGDTQPAFRNPWLGYLYIEPSYRRQGLAKFLTQYAVDYAQSMGYKKVYLYASDERSRYQKWGWQPLETLDFQGEKVTVMQSPK